MQISKNLLDFLLTVELVFKPDGDHDQYEFQKLTYDTSESLSVFYLKMQKPFQKEIIYDEIKTIINFVDHPASDEIIEGIIALFSLSEKTIRNSNLVNNYFYNNDGYHFELCIRNLVPPFQNTQTSLTFAHAVSFIKPR